MSSFDELVENEIFMDLVRETSRRFENAYGSVAQLLDHSKDCSALTILSFAMFMLESKGKSFKNIDEEIDEFTTALNLVMKYMVNHNMVKVAKYSEEKDVE